MPLSDCETCMNFSPKYSSELEGTCTLDRVFVIRTHSCDRWSDARAFHVDVQSTRGATGVDDPTDIVSQGVVADFGEGT